MEGRVCFEYRSEQFCLFIGWNQCWSIHYVIQSPSRFRSRVSAAIICIGRPTCLCSGAAICIDRSICHRWKAAICIGQPRCHPESAAIWIDCTNMPPSSIWFTIHIEIHIALSKVWKIQRKCEISANRRVAPGRIYVLQFVSVNKHANASAFPRATMQSYLGTKSIHAYGAVEQW